MAGSPSAQAAPADNPEEIIRQADRVRGPQGNFTVSVTITSTRPQFEPRTAQYEVMIKDRDRSVVKTLAPARERGRILLMIGDDLWLFMPKIDQPIRISMQQRLMGEVSNGDIVRTDFSGDYASTILKTENVDGKESWVLELKAKRPSVTYHRVVYWVQKKTYNPLKAEFYSISGTLLKTAAYEDFKRAAGRVRPMRLVLSDPLIRGQRSVMQYENMKVRNLPDKYFTKDYLKKLSD
jgi:outer membrane lipoprotein-sorting protein